MPERPDREISRAVATRRSPSLPGRIKEILHCAATARSLWELQANANAESARVKIKPPWAMPCPFTMCGRIFMARTAFPALISRISMPRALLASSSFHMASAHARARSSGESVVLRFIAPVRMETLLPSRVPSHVGLLGTGLFLAEVCFSARRRLGYARDVIATTEIAPYFQRSRTIQSRAHGTAAESSRESSYAGGWQHCRSGRVAHRSRLRRDRFAQRLLPAQRAARLVGRGRQPPDQDLRIGARGGDRSNSAAGRGQRRRHRQIDLSAADVLGALDVHRRVIVRLWHGAFERLRLASTGAARSR